MSGMLGRVRVVLTLVVSVLAVAGVAPAVSQDGATLVALAGAAALGIAAASVVVRLTAVSPARSLRVGHRAEQDPEPLASEAEPEHPDTTGRPRPRAPGMRQPAA